MNDKVCKTLFLWLVVLVSACTVQSVENNRFVATPPISSSNDEIPIEDSLSTRNSLLHKECPSLSDSDTPIWSNGSVLFGTGRLAYPNYAFPDPYSPQAHGIWSISASNLISKTQLAIEIPSPYASWIYISPNGESILHIERNNDASNGDEAVFYKMNSNSELRMPIDPDPILSVEWLKDGRFKYLSNIDRSERIGENREYIILDPNQINHEIITEEIELPGYFFDPIEIEHGLPSGYDAIDPSGQFVLYTAMLDDGINIVLRNINTGEILWKRISAGIPASPVQAEWSGDGSDVIFMVNSSNANGKYREIVKLTRDGKEVDLQHQPYMDLDENIVRYLTQSPGGRYIIYAVWDGAWIGSGFVVDTQNLTIGEICYPGVKFLDGVWISNSQFAYRVLIQDGENQKHSMRLLDIPNWATQILYETSPGYGINIFGWTPVEFP